MAQKSLRKTRTVHEVHWKTLFNMQTGWIRQYKRAIAKVMAEQEREIISRNTKAFEEWLFGQYAQRYLAVLLPLAYALSDDAAKVGLDSVGDDQTNYDQTQVDRLNLQERISRFSQEADEETRRRLREAISEALANSEPKDKLVEKVEDIFSNAKTVRAERIAVTEVSWTSNEAVLRAYKQSGVVKGKEWVVEPGCCEFCSAMEGMIVELDAPFATVGGTVTGTRGGEYPVNWETIQHPPLHPHCRCDILGFIDEVHVAMEDREIFQGVVVNDDEERFLSRNEVTYATGGFTQDPNLIAQYDPKTNEITLFKPDAKNKRMVVMHEVGHAVDTRFDIEGGLLSNGNALNAVNKDREAVIFNRLKMRNGLNDAQTRDLIENLKPFYPEQFDYYGKPREVFADGYAQYRSDPAAFEKYAPNLFKFYRSIF